MVSSRFVLPQLRCTALLSLAWALGGVITPAAADETFQHSIGLGIAKTQFDEFADENGQSLNYSYAFNPISTAGHPYAEAGFLERASGVGVQVDRSSSREDNYKAESDSIVFWLTYVNKQLPVSLDAYVARIRDDFDFDGQFDTFDTESTTQFIFLRPGVFLGDGQRVSVGIVRGTIDATSSDLDYSDGSYSSINIQGESVSKFENAMALRIDVAVSRNQTEYKDAADDSSTGYSAIVGWYVNRALGIHLGYDYYDGDDWQRDQSLRVEWFVTPQFRTGLEVVRSSYTSDDSQSQHLEFGIRF